MYQRKVKIKIHYNMTAIRDRIMLSQKQSPLAMAIVSTHQELGLVGAVT